MKCDYCNKHLELSQATEFYPHEAGGYCVFMPRDKTHHACKECASKVCSDCGKEQPRFAFIECKKCKKTHCYNNTDMKYEGNPFLQPLKLCDSRNCSKK